jgi:hypothetical protein
MLLQESGKDLREDVRDECLATKERGKNAHIRMKPSNQFDLPSWMT